MAPIFLWDKFHFLCLKAHKVSQITQKQYLYMFSLILCYIVDYTYFPKSQMIAINHEINCLLKKLNFSVLWQQRQNFLGGLISQLFVYGSLTHFEAYISHMDMENYNETHSLTKKLARTFQTSLIEI